MNIDKLNEEIENVLSEAKLEPNFGNNAINFDSIGCGIDIQTGTSEDEFFTLHLEGFSANSGKNIVFKSKNPVGYGLEKEERLQNQEEFKKAKEQVKEALLQAANDFDKQVVEIMQSYGFTQEK